MPWVSSRSVMFSAITTGSPISSTWLARNRFRRRFVASTISSTASGRPTSPTRPSSTSTVTISSGDCALSE